MSFAFRLTQGIYGLALGAWVGAIVMLAIAAAITFRTVRSHEPTLGAGPYASAALAEQAPEILAGGIVGNVIRGLNVVQAICGIGVGITLLLQCTLFADRLAGGVLGPMNLVRSGLLLLAACLVLYGTFVVQPEVWSLRETVYAAGASEAEREAARAAFDQAHGLSERLMSGALFLLAAALLLSPFAYTDPAGTGGS